MVIQLHAGLIFPAFPRTQSGLKTNLKPEEEWLQGLKKAAMQAQQSPAQGGSDAAPPPGGEDGGSLKGAASSKSAQERERLRQLQEELGGIISLLSGAQGLGLSLDPEWALGALQRAVSGATGSADNAATEGASDVPHTRGGKYKQPPAAVSLQSCSADELSGLASALMALGATPSDVLMGAFAQAVWPKLIQLKSGQVGSPPSCGVI